MLNNSVCIRFKRLDPSKTLYVCMIQAVALRRFGTTSKDDIILRLYVSFGLHTMRFHPNSGNESQLQMFFYVVFADKGFHDSNKDFIFLINSSSLFSISFALLDCLSSNNSYKLRFTNPIDCSHPTILWTSFSFSCFTGETKIP